MSRQARHKSSGLLIAVPLNYVPRQKFDEHFIKISHAAKPPTDIDQAADPQHTQPDSPTLGWYLKLTENEFETGFSEASHATPNTGSCLMRLVR